jgi:hypothetical protein
MRPRRTWPVSCMSSEMDAAHTEPTPMRATAHSPCSPWCVRRNGRGGCGSGDGGCLVVQPEGERTRRSLGSGPAISAWVLSSKKQGGFDWPMRRYRSARLLWVAPSRVGGCRGTRSPEPPRSMATATSWRRIEEGIVRGRGIPPRSRCRHCDRGQEGRRQTGEKYCNAGGTPGT